MKANWHTERDKRKELEARLAALESSATKTSDADRKLNARIVRAEIKAAAAGKLADPTDALALLDLSAFEVSDDGDVDAQKVSAAIEDLLTRKPHLAATAKPRFQGSGDGGAARKTSGPDQLTRADLKGKSPEFIAKAKADGRLNDLLGIK
ncbi:hypothetical protein ABZ192_12735 [Streptomyces sp. NPDC006235]|uniref:phage scaffolding protein n=1 Tax=Streptomyces sp. NPDC006235 TaxID=3156736 RepID=UPI0033B82860